MVRLWEWGEVNKALLKACPFTGDLGGSEEVVGTQILTDHFTKLIQPYNKKIFFLVGNIHWVGSVACHP